MVTFSLTFSHTDRESLPAVLTRVYAEERTPLKLESSPSPMLTCRPSACLTSLCLAHEILLVDSSVMSELLSYIT